MKKIGQIEIFRLRNEKVDKIEIFVSKENYQIGMIYFFQKIKLKVNQIGYIFSKT